MCLTEKETDRDTETRRVCTCVSMSVGVRVYVCQCVFVGDNRALKNGEPPLNLSGTRGSAGQVLVEQEVRNTSHGPGIFPLSDPEEQLRGEITEELKGQSWVLLHPYCRLVTPECLLSHPFNYTMKQSCHVQFRKEHQVSTLYDV